MVTCPRSGHPARPDPHLPRELPHPIGPMANELLELYVQCGESLLQGRDPELGKSLLVAGAFLAKSLGDGARARHCQECLRQADPRHEAAQDGFDQNAALRQLAEETQRKYPVEELKVLQRGLVSGPPVRGSREEIRSALPRMLSSPPSALGRMARNPRAGTGGGKSVEELRRIIHAKLDELADRGDAKDLPEDARRKEVRPIVERVCDTENPLLNRMERERLIDEVIHDRFGLGILDALLGDSAVEEVFVYGPGQVYVRRLGKRQKVDYGFRGESHLRQVIGRILEKTGHQADDAIPPTTFAWGGDARVTVVLPPHAPSGPCLRILRPKGRRVTLQDLLTSQALAPAMALFLEAAVKARVSILIGGASNSGRTTLLGILSCFIPAGERVIAVEETPELSLPQDQTVQLVCRPYGSGLGLPVTPCEVLRQALALGPDRLIWGECRGPETLELLMAMNTGQEGTLTTVFALTAADALHRVERLALLAAGDVRPRAVRAMIASAVQLLVQTELLPGGARKVIGIEELRGMEGEAYVTAEIFRYRAGQFEATGVRPACAARVEAEGIKLPADLFRERALRVD